MAPRLLLDLEKGYHCRQCTVKCAYDFTHGTHDGNNGAFRLQELGMYAAVCRRCEESPCTVACPEQAIERKPDGLLTRHLMRCTSCKTCTMACPFGCRYPELVGYKTPQCDLCVKRSAGAAPQCVASCQPGALTWTEVEADAEKGIVIVNDYWAVKATPWQAPPKRRR